MHSVVNKIRAVEMCKRIIKRIVISVFNYIYDAFIHYKRIWLSKNIQISIGDIMYVRQDPTNNQLGVAFLLLDIERYCSGDTQLRFHTIMKKLHYGDDYDATKDNDRFLNLVKSFLEKGYNNSKIFVDSEIRLFNGTHRTALCLYTGTDFIRARMLPQKEDYIKNSISYFEGLKLPVELQEVVLRKLTLIQEDLINRGNCFFYFIRNGFDAVEIYLNEKIERKKVFYIHENSLIIHKLDLSYGGRLCAFFVDNPLYKYNHHTIISSAMVEFEKVIREQFKINESNFWISKSCYEGKQMYDELTPYFVKD